jgi:hypothetical protein
VVHTGLMELVFLAKNDNDHYLPELVAVHRCCVFRTLRVA